MLFELPFVQQRHVIDSFALATDTDLHVPCSAAVRQGSPSRCYRPFHLQPCVASKEARARSELTQCVADLMSAVLWNPDTKAQYFTRLRQLVERYNNNTRSWLEDQVWALKEQIAVDARADAALWHTTNDFDSAVHALVEQVCRFSNLPYRNHA